MIAWYGLARNPALPPALLERLIALADHHVDVVLAGRNDLSPAQTAVLATRSEQVLIETDCGIEPPGSEFEVALQQAADEATPPSALAELVRHPNASIRHVVARRRALPQWAWERLAEDAAEGVRKIVACNPAAPEAVLRELAAKSDRETRRILVRNRAIPLDLLISFVALTTPSLVPRVAVASETELRTLASSAAAAVRLLAAHRHDLPGDVLDLLFADPEPDVAAAIATNPALSVARLQSLAGRHGPKVFAGIAQNPNCTSELLDLMARNARTSGRAHRQIVKHPSTSAETLLLCLGDREARRLAASRPDLPVAALVALLGDPHAGQEAAANPSLPVTVMEELLNSTT